MKPIELPILYKSKELCDAEEQEEKMNIPVPDGLEPEIRPVTFYVHSTLAISPHNYNGNWYTAIHANATEYICPLSYKELKGLVDLIARNESAGMDEIRTVKKIERLLKEAVYE